VSDDGHDAATESACRAAEVDVDYVLGPQRGLGANRNCALAVVRSDLVLFLDDDCLLLPDFLDVALGRMRSAEERHGHGRVIISGRESNRGHLISAADQTFLGFQSRLYGDDQQLRSIVINAAVFPAGVFQRLEFDPQLVYGYEEVDLASRATANGWVIVQCDDAVNEHRPSPRSRDDYDRHVEASRLYVTLRRYSRTDRARLRAAIFAIVAPGHVLAANVKRHGGAGIRPTADTLRLASRMLWRAR
jgi:glycosyltransferase involved in cell wall biosynthesis